jgi:hypothetical protein
MMEDDPFTWLIGWLGDRVFGTSSGTGAAKWATEAAEAAARAHGLEHGPGEDGVRLLAGGVGPYRVEAWVWVDATDESLTLRYRCAVSGGTQRVSFRRRVPKDGDARSGDPAFDDRVFALGDAPLWWSAPTRAAVLRCVELGGSLSRGEVSFESARLGRAASTADVSGAIAAAVEALQACASASRDARTLAAEDPLPGVRAHALRAVLRGSPDPEWLAERANDPDADVAAIAALAWGPSGLPRLRELLATAAGPDTVRAAAGRLPVGDPAFDAALVRALASAPALDLVRLARDHGGVAVVGALRRLGGPLRGPAQEAAKVVQDRAPVGRGSVSLAEDGAAGALSTVEAERGAVSEAADAGRLSDGAAGDPSLPLRP